MNYPSMHVSVITPITEDRRYLLPSLQEVIAAQDYCGKVEHIMVWGDGTTGYKRNKACEQANGDIILHMDSDDWYSPACVLGSIDT
ncbi:MAG: glycosyltransferase family 2 protein [Sphingobacteriales bacterium]|nr:MAG: glycosyltransferase family 2 protein [Sphingobacteriales bacterium]